MGYQQCPHSEAIFTMKISLSLLTFSCRVSMRPHTWFQQNTAQGSRATFRHCLAFLVLCWLTETVLCASRHTVFFCSRLTGPFVSTCFPSLFGLRRNTRCGWMRDSPQGPIKHSAFVSQPCISEPGWARQTLKPNYSGNCTRPVEWPKRHLEGGFAADTTSWPCH